MNKIVKKNINIVQIAKELKLSASTVSRALHNNPKISLATKQRVRELAERLNYVPNPAAMLLRENRTQRIGVLLPFFREEFFSMNVTGIEDAVIPHDYQLMISQSRDNFEREKMILEGFLKARIDGLIVSVSAETNHYAHFKKLEDYGIPIVFFDRIPRNLACNKVRSNVSKGAMEAVSFLVKKGLTRIAIINGPGNLQVSDERLNGYLQAILQFGIETNQNLIKTTDLSREDTESCISSLLSCEKIPQAILTFNDYVALHAMAVCRKVGIMPNKDILFVSFANLPITQLLENPPVASVEQFAYDLGKTAAELLLKKIANKDTGNYEEFLVNTELRIH